VTLEAVALAALAAGAAVLLAILAVAARRSRRRRRAEEAAREANGERAVERLAWLTGRAEAAPPVTPRPVTPTAPVPVLVAPLEQPALSPRRRLGRDTALVLLAGIAAVAVVAILRPTALDERGAVLAATASPVASPGASSPTAPTSPAATPAAGTASPAASPAPSSGTPASPAASPASPSVVSSPAAPQSGSPRPSPTPLLHVVQPGETLLRIASRYGVPIEAILAANPQISDRNLIVSRTVIIIPRPARSGSGDEVTPAP
jgi:LysM repeat protein